LLSHGETGGGKKAKSKPAIFNVKKKIQMLNNNVLM
jgi:hypothetical protein